MNSSFTIIFLTFALQIMKSDEDVRMISAEAPVLFAKACEFFIHEMTLRAWNAAEEHKRRTLQRGDIATAISRTEVWDFLLDSVPLEGEAAAAVEAAHGDAAGGPSSTAPGGAAGAAPAAPQAPVVPPPQMPPGMGMFPGQFMMPPPGPGGVPMIYPGMAPPPGMFMAPPPPGAGAAPPQFVGQMPGMPGMQQGLPPQQQGGQ
jgi:nuclear transcription factor Y, gamma